MATPTLMRDLADRERLAGDVLAFADQLSRRPAKARAAGGNR